MAGEWVMTTLGDSPLEIIDGDRGSNYPKQQDFNTIGHCLFLNAGNVTTSGFNFTDCAFISAEKDLALRKGKLKRHDVVLTTRGTVGNVAFFDESIPYDHIRINSGMVILRAQPEKLRPRFLYLFLRSFLFRSQVESLRTGSAQPQLPIRDIKRIKIPVPSPVDQDAIAHILGTLDDKIELNRRMSETLERMAQALFKSWFVDFDPVVVNALRAGNPLPEKFAERAAHYRENPDALGLPDPILRLFPARFVDSELGEIPEGWKIKTIGDLMELAYGKALKSEHRRDGKVPVYGSNGQVGWHDERLTRGPGIVVGRKGNPGVVMWAPTDFFVIDTAFYVMPKGTCYSLRFLFHVLRTHDLASLGADSAVPGLNRNLAYMNPQVLPPPPLLESFDSMTEALGERVNACSEESRTLAALRDALLPRLISGQLRVKDAERFLKERGL